MMNWFHNTIKQLFIGKQTKNSLKSGILNSFTGQSFNNMNQVKEYFEMQYLILDHIPMGVYWKDTSYKFMGCNAGFAKFTGFNKPSDLIGLSDFDFLSEDIANKMRQEDIGICLEGKTILNKIQSVFFKDGRSRFIDKTKLPLKSSNGDIIGIIGILEDVTEKIQSRELLKEKESTIRDQKLKYIEVNEDLTKSFSTLQEVNKLLAESEEKFRLISEQSIMGVFIVMNGKFEYFNERFIEITGFDKNEINSWRNYDFLINVHADYLEKVQTNLQEKLSGKQTGSTSYSVPIYTKSGKLKWIDIWSKAISYKNKLAMLVTILDIDEQKKYEKYLSESRENLSVTLNSINDAIIVTDKDGVINRTNPIAEKLLQEQNQSLIGMNINKALIIKHSRSDRRIEIPVDEIINFQKVVKFSKFSRLITKSGNFNIEGNVTPITTDQNEAIGTIVAFRDVTDKYRLTKAIHENEGRLRAKLDFILSPDADITDIKLKDVVNLEHLQKIQDALANALKVASVITTLEGNSITRPTNVHKVCSIFQSTDEGKMNCVKSFRDFGELVAQSLKPIYDKCNNCGFYQATAPIIVGGKPIALWTLCAASREIQQLDNLIEKGSSFNLDANDIRIAYNGLPEKLSGDFQLKTELMWLLAREISSSSYRNLKLARQVEQSRLARKELEQSESNLYTLLNSTSHAYFLVNRHSVLLQYNVVAKQLIQNINELELNKNTPFLPYFPSSLEAFFTRHISKALNGVTSIKEFNIELLNGLNKWFEIRFIPVQNIISEIVGVAIAAIDITESKFAQETLRESEELYRMLINTSPDSIMLTNLNDEINLISPNTLKLLGYKNQSELIGNDIFFLISEFDYDIFNNLKNEVIMKGYSYNNRLRIRGNRKSFFYGEINAGILRNDIGNPQGIVYVLRDISQRIETEKELIEAKERAEESDKLKSAFLANMSHEIRTPMNGILGFANLLEDPDINDKEKQEYIQIINSNSKALLSLIDDIIDIAKIEAGQLRIKQLNTKIMDITEHVYLLFDNVILGKNSKVKLQLDVDTEYRDTVILTDPQRLKQILTNLVSNAVKFTENGIIRIGFKFQDNDNVLFYVEDTGIGIEEENLSIIFDRFRQVEGPLSRTHGGTGLGLTIVKHLISLLNGEIWVKSTPGEGSTFYFTLPGRISEKSDSKTTKKSSMELSKFRGQKIIVAEDEEINFFFVKEALKKQNVQIIHARNGHEVLELIKEHPDTDMILMDIKMPGKDGLEITSILRNQGYNLPIIALTAYAMNEDRERCLEAGCNDFIAKPVKKDDLIHTILKNF